MPASASPAAERSRDDSDVGWGDLPRDPSDDDERYLRDKPPHWS